MQFTAYPEDPGSEKTDLVLHAELAVDAKPFAEGQAQRTSRPETAASIELVARAVDRGRRAVGETTHARFVAADSGGSRPARLEERQRPGADHQRVGTQKCPKPGRPLGRETDALRGALEHNLCDLRHAIVLAIRAQGNHRLAAFAIVLELTAVAPPKSGRAKLRNFRGRPDPSAKHNLLTHSGHIDRCSSAQSD